MFAIRLTSKLMVVMLLLLCLPHFAECEEPEPDVVKTMQGQVTNIDPYCTGMVVVDGIALETFDFDPDLEGFQIGDFVEVTYIEKQYGSRNVNDLQSIVKSTQNEEAEKDILKTIQNDKSHFGARGLNYFSKKDELDFGCQLASQAGAGWWHVGISWNSVEPEKPQDGVHHYRWKKTDKKIQASLNFNIDVLPITTCKSSWGSIHKKGSEGGVPKPEHMEDYQDFIRHLIERYDGDGMDDAPFVTPDKRIKHWVVENEPGPNHWCASSVEVTAQEYASHFIITQQAIKETDPTAQVSLAGFGSAGALGLNDTTTFTDVLQLLSEQDVDFDFLVFHNYKQPETIPICFEFIQDKLNQYGFGAKKVWLTETNFYKDGIKDQLGEPTEYNKIEFDALVAEGMVKRFVYAFSTGIETVIEHTFVDQVPWPEKSSFSYYRGLVDRELNPKPVYYAYQTMASRLEAFDYADQIHESSYYLFKFDFSNKNSVYVAWSDDEKQVDLDLGPVKATDIYGNETVRDSSELTLTGSPLFVEQMG